MNYASIDIETTGLNPETCNILSVGIVIEDTQNIVPIEDLPKLHVAILREDIKGSVFAINLNKELISNINRYQCARTKEEKELITKETDTIYLEESQVVETIYRFLWDNGIRFDNWEEKIKTIGKEINERGIIYPSLTSGIPKTYLNVAGKNFGTFDKLFLEKLPKWNLVFKVRSRIIDPGILFLDWKNDESIPGLDKCKERAGIDGVVTHNAVEDAIDVIKLLRHHFIGYENK